MEMILNENDIVVGAQFENGTIQDYIDDAQTYGLVRINDATVNWFLYNDLDSPEDLQELYKRVVKSPNHSIQDDHGEQVVMFDKQGDVTFEEFASIIDAYLDAEMGNYI